MTKSAWDALYGGVAFTNRRIYNGLIHSKEEEKEMTVKIVDYLLVAKEQKDEEGKIVKDERVLLHSIEREVVGPLPAAEDVKDEKEFRKARTDAKLKLSEVELRVNVRPFVKA